MGEKNGHTHEHLQFHIFNMSLLGREEGRRTDLLDLPVPYAPAQKIEQEL